MCMSCGCNKIHDEHGDKRNITYEMMQEAAKAAGISFQECWENMKKGAAEARESTKAK